MGNVHYDDAVRNLLDARKAHPTTAQLAVLASQTQAILALTDAVREVTAAIAAAHVRDKPEQWETFEDVPVGTYFHPVSMPDLVLEKVPNNLYEVKFRPHKHRDTRIVVADLAPFARAGSR